MAERRQRTNRDPFEDSTTLACRHDAQRPEAIPREEPVISTDHAYADTWAFGMITIRRAGEDDLAQMHRVRMSVRENRLANPDAVQPGDYRMRLRSGRGWICERDGDVVGFAIADAATSSIWALFVDPEHERQGIGRLLHDSMIAWLFANGATRISLTTDPHTRAERFYRTAGWLYVGTGANGEAQYQLPRERFDSGEEIFRTRNFGQPAPSDEE